jgi:hypothetical protein
MGAHLWRWEPEVAAHGRMEVSGIARGVWVEVSKTPLSWSERVSTVGAGEGRYSPK